ncbi:MAG: hypothetical protein R2942_02720 [Ignavibacteria bacterium]
MPGQTEKFLELLKPCYSDALKYCKALCAKRDLWMMRRRSAVVTHQRNGEHKVVG